MIAVGDLPSDSRHGHACPSPHTGPRGGGDGGDDTAAVRQLQYGGVRDSGDPKWSSCLRESAVTCCAGREGSACLKDAVRSRTGLTYDRGGGTTPAHFLHEVSGRFRLGGL